MSNDIKHKHSGGEPNATVGYKRPPVEHRFQKGHSGNRRGRPKKTSHSSAQHSLGDVEALMLEEAYRLVSIRDGDNVIQMPTIQAVMRGLAVAAIKGSHRAQVTFKEHTQAIEAKRLAEKQQLFEATAEYKWYWEREFAECDRLGKPRPDPVPHPDDIQLDVRKGEARFVGPQDYLHRAYWNEMRDRKQASVEEIRQARDLMKTEPKLRKMLEQNIAFEQHLSKAIDYFLPDEATRRHPTYDPSKRGEPPKKFKYVLPAKPPVGAKKLVVRRRRADPEG